MIKKLIINSLASTVIISGNSVITNQYLDVNKSHIEQILKKWNNKIKSFKKAKKILYSKIYKDKKNKKTIYCGCEYANKKDVNLTSCWLNTIQNIQRANRIEVEHIVPVQAFGRSFKSYREWDKLCINSKWKKYTWRRCAKKVSAEFRLMEADLYNLYPADWYINQTRSNFSMWMIPWDDYRIWKKKTTCEIEIDNKFRKIEPRNEIKWDIARVYQYMNLNYPNKWIISKKNKKLFEYWSKFDPISKEECRRYFLIKKVQQNINLILSKTCKTEFKPQKKEVKTP